MLNLLKFTYEGFFALFRFLAYDWGMKEWNQEKGYLTDTCLSAQDTFKKYLDNFRIYY